MITEFIAEFATSIIQTTGYLGIFALMILESIIAPIPSEAVMPFAGFLVAEGKLSLIGVIVSSTLGSIVGSLSLYYFGLLGGRKLIVKYGKYFLISEKELNHTDKFFKKHGEATIFIGRFIPVVRHLISLPAGITKMSLPKFILYTAIGAGIWNTILTIVGIVLKENWTELMKYTAILDIIIVVLIIAFILFFIYTHLSKSK